MAEMQEVFVRRQIVIRGLCPQVRKVTAPSPDTRIFSPGLGPFQDQDLKPRRPA